jgi:acyl-coenzyme A synthetase/AMP-(fatty) acid ligase
MIANLAGAEVRPGSMGRPLPGVEVAVLALMSSLYPRTRLAVRVRGATP